MSNLGDRVLFYLKLIEYPEILPESLKAKKREIYKDVRRSSEHFLTYNTYYYKPNQPSKFQGKLLSIGSDKNVNDIVVPSESAFHKLVAPSLTPSMGSAGHHQPLSPAALCCSAPNLTCHISGYIFSSSSVRAAS